MNHHRVLSRALKTLNRKQLSPPLTSTVSRSFSNSPSQSTRASFGIAFDIDGVVLLGSTPIGGSPQAFKRLYDDSGALKIPYIFLTNGGGFPESRRAFELSQLLGVNISASQVVQGHSPFKQFSNVYENKLVVAVGKGEPAAVMSEYGFKNVLSMDEYASHFDNIDPLAPYKKLIFKQTINEMAPKVDVRSQKVEATFIVSDPVDWSRDIQVLCDILRTGGLPGKEIGQPPPLYFANDDLEYQANFPSERLGMGAFRIALESIFSRIHPNSLKYTAFGKPNPLVFRNAETVLKQLVSSLLAMDHANVGSHHFKTLYMIGDNPSVDIKGAQQAGHRWFSILTRTGVFKGKENHTEFPADLVVDTIEEAVDHILRKECT
ncbi:Hydrolase_like domain-containing protein/Hydrolase_6 domain-containing protein [Cephalotus follicularis]|uniref:Hydrolase_like domain-containing protein/Hydrolase_6 domain-containing protein n=1 Tax=Cephalotus follicularis TaxID=3775 RepID=A0A1Q3BTU4_CEPFO|nr:Hydrolase_like domain-containing protein/Hydrolase_6 domain-containing protein [Cephalotus follicularis]